MRRVPYAILGDGRVATHFCHYFTLLAIPYTQWSRRADPDFQQLESITHHAERILILVKDAAIIEFVERFPFLKSKTCIHFSGQLSTPFIASAHPLMTFNPTLYDLATYQKIPFILEKSGHAFAELLPNLSNPHYYIPTELKSFYHALCVMSGNFTAILWQKFFTELETTFQLPKALLHPYMQQIFHNLQQQPELALTGPLIRNDQKTIAANLQALQHDPFQKIYQVFVETYQQGEKT
jgi:predicted short-subunit dehydrogenase-like oxidoreductase (DUF2520 family)